MLRIGWRRNEPGWGRLPRRTADKAVAAVVRSTSPILSMVPEDRSRLGDAPPLRVMSAIPFRRFLQALVFRCGPAKIQTREVL